MTFASIIVNPNVLRWARESGGFTIEYVSAKTKLPQSKLKEWESRPSEIQFNNLEKLANVFKRPIMILLKDSPPSEPKIPPYFRRNGDHAELGQKAILVIRKARSLQKMSKELISNLDIKSVFEQKPSYLDMPADEIAEKERKSLGITYQEQIDWKEYSIALRKLREHIEAKNVFVFQIGLPVEQLQGLSLIDEIAPVIVLNSKDILQRRIFTLMHEYAHILVGSPGICADIDAPEDDALEIWCNKFAGSFLMPKKELYEFVKQKITGKSINYETIKTIARHFSVSTHMAFVRLKINGLLSSTDISTLSKIFDKEPKASVKKAKSNKNKKAGGVPQYRKVLSERGTKFVNLVFENEKKRKISSAETLDYLSIKLENVEKVKSAVGQ